MTITFRRAERDDVDAIVALLADDELGRGREQFEQPLPQAYLDAFAEIDADEHQLLAVATNEDGDVVGTLQLTFIPGMSFIGGTRAQIEAVRVHSSLRGQGVGRAFFAWAIDEARRRRCRMVQLTTNNRRDEAQQFYVSLGFQPTHVGMKLVLDG